MRPLPLAAAILGTTLLIGTARADERGPVGWRGDGTGVFRAAHPPLEWDPAKNVAWKARLPGPAASAPIVDGDRVFVTSEPSTVLCLAAGDGRVLWTREVTYLDTVPEAERPRALAEAAEAARLTVEVREARAALDAAVAALRRSESTPERLARVAALQKTAGAKKERLQALARHRPPEDVPLHLGGNAGATPVSDGEHVYVLFGNDVAAALDVKDGRVWWTRWLPPRGDDGQVHPIARGQAASPVLIPEAGLLLAPMSRLHALDARTGEVRWSSVPWSEGATPALVRTADGPLALTPEGDAINLRDGKVVLQGLGRLVLIGPAADANRAFYIGSYEASGATGDGLARAEGIELPSWSAAAMRRRGPIELQPARFFAPPLLVEGRLLSVDRNGVLTVLDAAGFRLVEQHPLRLNPVVRGSVAAAGGYLYVSNDAEQGGSTTVVVEAKPPWREVGRNHLERFLGPPFFAGDRMYVRGVENLYCIAQTR